MELKTARLTLLIDPAKKAAFERLCARRDLTPSQVVRQFIRDYLAQHNEPYVPSGANLKSPAQQTAAPSRAPREHRPGPAPAKPRKRG
jgi:Ribbon-helix-helix protein